MREKNMNQDQKNTSFLLAFMKWFGVYLVITAVIYVVIFTIILVTHH